MIKSIVLAAFLSGFSIVNSMNHEPPFNLSPEDMHNCLESTGANMEEIHNFHKDGTEVSESAYCMIKCLAEKIEVIDEDGKINQEKIQELPLPPHFSKESVNKLKECLASVKSVNTCMDMEPIKKCAHEFIFTQ